MALLFKNLLFTVVVPATVGVYLPLMLAQGRSLVSGWMFWAGAALVALGAAVYAWCVWDFAVFGRGTPAPIDAPKRLVVRGLYRFVRNPMYLGVLTVILGWAALFQSARLLVYAFLVGSGFHLVVLVLEEPALQRLFGEEYGRYRERVNRWTPRIPRPAHPRPKRF